jgi:zinc protease
MTLVFRHLTLCMAVLAAVLCVSAVQARDDGGIVEVVSPGGIKAWLRQDSSIPLLAIDFQFQGGSSILPAEKAGTAVLAARMLSEGAGEWDGEAFRQMLADNAIGLGFQADRDSLSGSLTTLSANRELAVRMLRAALTAPHLDDAALRQERSALVTELRRRMTRPDSIAFRNWFNAAFQDHPYSNSPYGTPETAAQVQLQDIVAFLDSTVNRRGLIVGVAGDITPSELANLLDQVFASLPDRQVPAPVPEMPKPPAGLIVVPQPSQQSVIVFGHAGIQRENPDWYAATLVTQILAGSTFTSRLGAEVREKRGLAYGIGAGLSDFRSGALLLGRTATRNGAAAETVQIVKDEWRRLAEEGPTAQELAEAKSYLIGSFPLSLDSTDAIASVLVQMQDYSLGREYWSVRPDRFNVVDLDEARRVAKRLLDPEALLFVVVGEPKDLHPTLPAKPMP